MEPFAWVYNIDLWVGPDPWTLLVCFIVEYCWAQDDDVVEDSTVGALEKV